MSKAKEIDRRRQMIVDYVNGFKSQRCFQPTSKIATILGITRKQCYSDIKYLIENGTIDIEDTLRGAKIYRVLIGLAPESTGKTLPIVTYEIYSYKGKDYDIPIKLYAHSSREINTQYKHRPKGKDGQAMMDWRYWDSRGLTVQPRKIAKTIEYFDPFDSDNYITTEVT